MKAQRKPRGKSETSGDDPREDEAKDAQQNPSVPPPPPPPREDDCSKQAKQDDGREEGPKEPQKNLTSPTTSPPDRDRKRGNRSKATHGEAGKKAEGEQEDTSYEPLEYQDFRLQIGRGPAGGFEVEVQSSPAGRARATTELPCEAIAVEGRLKELWKESKTHDKRDLARDFDASIGSRLFAAAFVGDVLQSLRSSIDGLRGVAAHGAPQGLRIRLLIGSPAMGVPLGSDTALAEDLLRVGSQPWEYAFDARAGGLPGRLACSRLTPIVRTLDAPYFVPPLETEPPLRILVVDCVPEDQNPLETERERRQLRSAIEDADVARVEILQDPTISELRQKLMRIQPHILHFIGHGGFNNERGDGYLCLVGDDGKTDRLLADELAQMLREVPNLRLVFLNACRTAQFPRRNGQDPWSATSAAILRAGIPSVIAMQFPIGDPAAVAFSSGFYRALREGDPLEAAVAEGRIAIQRLAPWEWGIPVLYLNTDKGEILNFQPKSATAPWRDGQEAPEALRLGIRSFVGWGADMKARVHQMLALDSYFDGRFIRDAKMWSETVAPKLSRFLKRWVKGDRPVELEMAAHQTLAFFTGYLLDAKGGLSLTLVQRTEGREPRHWRQDEGEIPPGPVWTVEESRLSPSGDAAVAIGVTRPVLSDVKDFLREQGIQLGRLLSVSLPQGFGQTVVKSGAHAAAMAQDLANLIDSRSPDEKCRVLHILGSAPNSLFLYLGRKARGFGEIQLYEYDLEKKGNKTYQPSLHLPLSGA